MLPATRGVDKSVANLVSHLLDLSVGQGKGGEMSTKAVTLHTTCSWCEVEAVFHGVAYLDKVRDRWGMATDNAVFDCGSCGQQFDVQDWFAHEFTD